MKSMTGFGRAECFSEELKTGFRVEISSINRKQFDLKISLPKEFSVFDTPIRTLTAERISRGSVTMRVEEFHHEHDVPPFQVDFSRAKILLEEARKFCRENGMDENISFSDIASIPDAVTITPPACDEERTLELLKSAVSKALDELVLSRENEGRNLKKELLGHLSVMEDLLEEVIPPAKELPAIQKEKLLKHLKELELECNADDERILREAVIYGDKLDVSEEIERLHSHFANFRKMADSPDAVGRSLDFMVQEIFRECNTLGNKAASTEISPKTVALKTELEKIREQVQNIE